MSKGKKKPAPARNRPATMADVNSARERGIVEGCRTATIIFLTVLLDKENADAEDLNRVWREIEDLSDSVAKHIVSVNDLDKVLREEYGVDVWKK